MATNQSHLFQYAFIDIDDCASSPCQHNSTCIELVGGYTCSCGPGLTGVHCEHGM